MNYGLIVQTIKKHEGLKLKPYRCSAGKLTIGYGRNLDDNGISECEAEWMLEDDIHTAALSLLNIFGDHLSEISTTHPKRFTALVDMMFNLGETKFRGFKRMISAIKRDDWETAAKEAKDSLWYTQVGTRGEDIVKMLEEG